MGAWVLILGSYGGSPASKGLALLIGSSVILRAGAQPPGVLVPRPVVRR